MSGTRTVVVTGGTGALGSAVCDAFLADGATVVATGRTADGAPGRAGLEQVAVDLTDEADALRLGAHVRERHGRCDALVCCAGGFAAGTPVATASLADWRRQLDLNATTAFLAARALVGLLQERPDSAVVLVASRSALQPFAGAAPYAASKAAVVALAQVLALEGREHGMRANAVVPSVIDTPANRAAMPDADTSRWVAPASLAATIRWLCSDAAADVSGAVVPVYGRA